MMLLERLYMMHWLKKVNAIDTSKFDNKKDYNDKIKDIKDEIPSITKSATTPAFTVVENNFTTFDFNKFTNNTLYPKKKKRIN